MQKRRLGKLDEMVLPLGFGCAAIGGAYTRNGRVASRGTVDDAETARAVHAALAHGIQLFDVGNIYGAGHAERVLGAALAGKRQHAILQVKFGASFDEVTRTQIDYEGPISESMIRNSLAGSLRRLQTDYVDIFQFQVGNYALEQLPDIVAILDVLVREGQIRAYSYGTREIERLRPFVEAAGCATVITNHNVLMDAPELLDYLAQHNVALLAGLPLYMGLLAGNIDASTVFDEQDARASWNLAAPHFVSSVERINALRPLLTNGGRSMAQGALAWLWARHPLTIPVPGFRTVAHVESSAAALQYGALDETTMAAIADVVSQE